MSILDPLHGDAYQFWSGIGGDFFLVTLAGAGLRHINCNEKGCWRRGHRHPDHGRPVCLKHYRSHAPDLKPPPEPK